MTRQMADDEVIGATSFDVLDEVAHDLESWCDAYPPHRFPEPEEADLKWLHATKPGLCDRISASMGRHMVKHMRRMAASVRSIEAKQMAAVAALQAERDEWSARALREQTAHHEAAAALEALRGQVAGLVEKWRAESNALPTLSHKGAGLDRGIKELSELLAIKERMG